MICRHLLPSGPGLSLRPVPELVIFSICLDIAISSTIALLASVTSSLCTGHAATAQLMHQHKCAVHKIPEHRYQFIIRFVLKVFPLKSLSFASVLREHVAQRVLLVGKVFYIQCTHTAQSRDVDTFFLIYSGIHLLHIIWIQSRHALSALPGR